MDERVLRVPSHKLVLLQPIRRQSVTGNEVSVAGGSWVSFGFV